MKLETHLRFFLGANTPQGFVSRFDQLGSLGDGWRQLVIKGGPGSGKSTMMKKIAQAMQEHQKDAGMQLIYCSSDVDSLDGVIVPEKKFCIIDGTPPHAAVRYHNKLRTLFARQVFPNMAHVPDHMMEKG